jgi:hypothetical protein
MSKDNTDGVIGIGCAIALSVIATFSITQYLNINRELEQTKIEYRGYRDGVKDSRP